MGKPGIVVLGLIGACGGQTDYLSMPPEEAAEAYTEWVCEVAFDCGVIDLDCSVDPCTASYTPPEWPNEAACVMDTIDLYRDLFAGCAAANLSDAQRADFNDCMGTYDGCLTQAELDELALAVTNGTPYGPESCRRAQSVFQLCIDCFQNPESPACAGS